LSIFDFQSGPGASQAPALQTERLTLRGHNLDDFNASLALWSDPSVTRFIGGRPATASEVWSRIMTYTGHWALMGFGYWAVVETKTGRFIGEVGLAYSRRDIDPPLDQCPESGWAFIPDVHGQGLASEAMRAALAWADDHFGRTDSVCMIDPANAPSITLAKRCGYSLRGDAQFRGSKTLIFER
jgi:RimJ/RimL family protein N-acetyltransferase